MVGLPLPRGCWAKGTGSLRLPHTATNLCLRSGNVYTGQRCWPWVMQQLMEQSPLPMLLMRTVIQSPPGPRPVASS